jgi:hypothetical protein
MTTTIRSAGLILPLCPVCNEPAHAMESDDLDRHLQCQPADSARCIVCSAAIEDMVIGSTKCEQCIERAAENRRGIHGRGPQDWQRKVDAALENEAEHEDDDLDESESTCQCVAKQQRGPYKWGWECRDCGRDMPSPEPDWDAMREARDERYGRER